MEVLVEFFIGQVGEFVKTLLESDILLLIVLNNSANAFSKCCNSLWLEFVCVWRVDTLILLKVLPHFHESFT